MKTKFLFYICLLFVFFSCQKNEDAGNPVFITKAEFVGSPEQFQEYQKLFLKIDEFGYPMSPESYAAYVNTVNSKAFQQQYFELKKETRDLNKPKYPENLSEVRGQEPEPCSTCEKSFHSDASVDIQ